MTSMYTVHPEAKIGNNVSIGNYTNIYEDVEIGDNCVIYGNVTILPGARICDNWLLYTSPSPRDEAESRMPASG